MTEQIATYELQGLTVHEVKSDPDGFEALWRGRKKFELRIDDRDYDNGDFLRLRETVHPSERMAEGQPLVYTEREVTARIDYVLRGPTLGLAEGWVILSVTPVATAEPTNNLQPRDTP